MFVNKENFITSYIGEFGLVLKYYFGKKIPCNVVG